MRLRVLMANGFVQAFILGGEHRVIIGTGRNISRHYALLSLARYRPAFA
jgi:arginase family enzyme